MGVHNLWTLLSPAGRKLELKALENRKIAVDISIWVIQMVYGFMQKGNKEFRNAHLIGIFKRIIYLLLLKIKPIFVFDGKPPSLKT